MEATPLYRQSIVCWAIASLLLSFAGYALAGWWAVPGVNKFTLFLPHFALVAGWFIALLLSGRLRQGRDGLPLVVLFLLMFLVSAFALNEEMRIMDASALWLKSILLSSMLVTALFALRLRLPRWLQQAGMVLYTAGFWLMVYFTIYLFPILVWGIIGSVALGLGMHAFVPMLLAYYMYRLWSQWVAITPGLKWVSAVTTALILIWVAAYCIAWNRVQHKMDSAFAAASLQTEPLLPPWLQALQAVPHGSFQQQVILQDFAFSTPEHNGAIHFLGGRRANQGFTVVHDPLVMTALFLGGKSIVPPEDRKRMLEVLQTNELSSIERLWSGDDLSTTHIDIKAEVWPHMRMSYTEYTFTVANHAIRYFEGSNQQEAIYAVQLPQDAVVTALSLWMGDVEEKALVATRQKAEAAYTTIVGREKRDPSLVQWSEGNQVLLRVFPVPAEGFRKFKIGVTAPLLLQDGRMVQQGLTIHGPSLEHTTTHMQLWRHGSPLLNPQAPQAFSSPQPGIFVYQGKYMPQQHITWPYTPIEPHSISLQGLTYNLQERVPALQPVRWQRVYADVNAAWSHQEWEQLLKAAQHYEVYVWNLGMVRVTPHNQQQLFDQLQQLSFSMFPTFAIPAPAHSLVISKQSGPTPSIAQLTGEHAHWRKMAIPPQGEKCLWFQVGAGNTMYLCGLRQRGLLRYASGTFSDALVRLRQQVFEEDLNTLEAVYLHESHMRIAPVDMPHGSRAPDHALRLYTYHRVLQAGVVGQQHQARHAQLTEAALYAQVVSPLSSMVVLETQRDYNRFDITDQSEGLQQAALQNSGAVPEPHEWALLILSLVCLAIYYFKLKLA